MTFDDAFRDFIVHALPALTAAGLSSTLFVPSGFVGTSSRWLVAEGEQRRPLLSWRELSELPAGGVEVGAHSHSHPQLDLLDRRAAAREIALSKALLEDHLQIPIRSFAYPFGYSKRPVRELVAQLGFDQAYAVADLVSQSSDDPFAVPRLTVSADTTVEMLAALLGDERTAVQEAISWSRASMSRALRLARMKKRANSPSRAPAPPTSPGLGG